MKQRLWIAGGACAALILLLAGIGYQQTRINNLNKRLDSVIEQLQTSQETTDNRISSLEKKRESLIASYSAELSKINQGERTVQFSITVRLNEPADNQDVWLEFHRIGGGKPFQWDTLLPDSSLTLTNQIENEYTALIDFSMDATQFELVLFVGDRSEVLQSCASIADILPVQVINCGGDVVYNVDQKMYYQTEWSASLSDANIASTYFLIYKNGKMVEETGTTLDDYKGDDGTQLTCWDEAIGHATPCKPGDEFEMHFVCTDKFGIQYDFLAERRVITETYPARCWLQTVTPTITWPE